MQRTSHAAPAPGPSAALALGSLGLGPLRSSLRPWISFGHRSCTLTASFFSSKLCVDSRWSVIRQGWNGWVLPRWELCVMCYHLQKIWQGKVRNITQQLWILSSSPFSAQRSSLSIWKMLTNAVLYFQSRGGNTFPGPSHPNLMSDVRKSARHLVKLQTLRNECR